jgi:hypothetical protein
MIPVVAVAYTVWLLGFFIFVSSAEGQPTLQVIYNPPYLSVEARDVTLPRVLREIGEEVGFYVNDFGVTPANFTFSITGATLEEVLSQLLRGENYAVVYRRDGQGIDHVLLLSSYSYYAGTGPLPESQSTPAQSYHESIKPLTRSSIGAATDDPRKARNIANATIGSPLNAGDLSQVDDSSRLGTPIPENSTPPVSQRPADSTSNSLLPAELSSTSPSAGDINETLAVMNRLAQQKLEALVEGLSRATNALLNIMPRKKQSSR